MAAKIIGGTLLISGTAIGAGLLALPAATASFGFPIAALLLILCWGIMCLSAFFILEVTLWLPENTNLVSMAGKTIGPIGQIVCWVCSLLLLYSLLAAYIAAGADFLNNIFYVTKVNLPNTFAPIIFTIILGAVVYYGIYAVDFMNRGLMALKFLIFFLLASLLLPHVHVANLITSHINWSGSGVMVIITSFGFAVIVPSLRNYFHGDVNKLRGAIFFGSLIPLVCYLIWNAVVMGVIPRENLLDTLQSGQVASGLIASVSQRLHENILTDIARAFTLVCLFTSFLGVALCLADFLADGLGLNRTGWHNAFICSLTFLPPLLIVLLKPEIFIMALSCAGFLVLVLLIIMPALMILFGRHKKINISNFKLNYQVIGGYWLPTFVLIFAGFLIAQMFVN